MVGTAHLLSKTTPGNHAMTCPAAAGCGPMKVTLNGADLTFIRQANHYRAGAAEIPLATAPAFLTGTINRLRGCRP